MHKQKSSSTAAFTFNTGMQGARPVTAKTHLMGVNSKISVQSTINHFDNGKKSRMLAKRRFQNQMESQVTAGYQGQNVINLNINNGPQSSFAAGQLDQ
jgi:hypothetical protein